MMIVKRSRKREREDERTDTFCLQPASSYAFRNVVDAAQTNRVQTVWGVGCDCEEWVCAKPGESLPASGKNVIPVVSTRSFSVPRCRASLGEGGEEKIPW